MMNIHPAIDALVQDIASQYSIDQILLFGSRARGDNMPRADVDIALDAPSLKEEEWLEVLELVEDAPTLLKIDCVHLQKQSGAFLDAILNDGVVLYEKH